MRVGRGLVAAVLAFTIPAVPPAGAEPPEAGAPPAASAPPAPAALSAPLAPETAATATARRTGRPVEIESMRSETRQVFARPDGTFTLEQHARPV
ncbi:hypothetical protein ACWCSD_52430, partial [Nonomuraea sp. NPDC001684]